VTVGFLDGDGKKAADDCRPPVSGSERRIEPLLDLVLIANEVVEEYRVKKREGIVFIIGCK